MDRHPSNQAKKLLNNKKLPKIWQFHLYFLLLHRRLQVAQLAWASEPIEFGSAFVSIYGKASSCALFLTSRNQVNQNLEKWNRQVSGSTLLSLIGSPYPYYNNQPTPRTYRQQRIKKQKKMEKKEKKFYQSPTMTVYEISRTQILAGSGQTEPITEEDYQYL